MTHYDRLKRKRLGDVLVDEGLVDREAMIRALQEQQLSRRLLSDILLEQEELPQYELAHVIVAQYQAPFIDIATYSFHKELIAEFPAKLLHESGVIPLDRFGEQICFACQEIPSPEHAERLLEVAGGGMYFYVGLAHDLKERLRDHAPFEEGDPVSASGEPLEVEQVLAEKSTAWKNLFDSADESIMSELTDITDED